MEDIERKLTLREERDRLLEILRVLPNEDYKDAEAKRLLNVRLTTINEALANEPIHAGKAEPDKDVLALTTEGEDMTNERYKGMLLDERENWEDLLLLAQEGGDERIIEKAKKQIQKINTKISFVSVPEKI